MLTQVKQLYLAVKITDVERLNSVILPIVVRAKDVITYNFSNTLRSPIATRVVSCRSETM